MAMRVKAPPGADATLQLTSMIDVVFLLLIFFIMTFKIAAQEGDFSVKMPLQNSGGQPLEPDSDLPIKLRLKADASGNLADIVVNDSQSFGKDFAKLRTFVMQMTPGGAKGPGDKDGPEVELDLDYHLRYEHVINAITSVTGHRQGDDIIRLVNRIKFAPPRKN
jgi:biopolymer transport protein ExbD